MYVSSSITYLPHLISSYLISSVHFFHSYSDCTVLQAGDGRDVSCPVITVPSGNEPSMFTAHFLVRHLTPHPHPRTHTFSLTHLRTYYLILSLTHTHSLILSFSHSVAHSLSSSLLSSIRLQYSEHNLLNRIFSDINPLPPSLLFFMFILFLHSYFTFSFLYLHFIIFYSIYRAGTKIWLLKANSKTSMRN